MDGFAVKSSDFNGSGMRGGARVVLKVIGEAAAGSGCGFSISSGEAVKIMTGAVLPAGADAILVKEAAAELKDEGSWSVSSEDKVMPGLHVRKIGADFSAGDVILPRGTFVNPAALGIAASSGYNRLKVFLKKTVAVVSTGDELIDPLSPEVDLNGFIPAAGKIMNSNLFLLHGLLKKIGLNSELCGIARDEPEDIASKIDSGLQKNDIVITTGGASVGSYDYIPAALELLGFKAFIWKMAIKPGRPFIFGVKNGPAGYKIVFGLPGNPASSLVSFIKLLCPALYKYSGRTAAVEELYVSGILSETVKKDPQRTTYLRAYIYNDDIGGKCQSVIKVPVRQDSNILTTALYANCLAEIPPGEGSIMKGEKVTARLI